LVGAVGGFAWGFFAFPMMDSGHSAIIISAVVIGLVFHGCMYAPQPAAMAEMFPTRMRYSGVSLGYQVTSIVAGSLAPIIAIRLLETYKSAVPIGWYLGASTAVTAVAVLASRETKGVDLAAIDLADAQRLTAAAQPVASAPSD
jgi:MFS family permease